MLLVGFGSAHTGGAQERALELSLREVELGFRARFEAYVAAEQWREAVETIDELLKSEGEAWGTVAQFETSPGVVTRYLPGRAIARRLLLRAPREVLTEYRRQHRAPPLTSDNTALPFSSAAALRRLDEAAFREEGMTALLEAIDEHLVRGEFMAARRRLRQLLPAAQVASEASVALPAYPTGPVWLAWQQLPLAQRNRDRLLTLTRQSNLEEPGSGAASWAELWARQIWISHANGQHARAAVELDLLRRIAPEARGRWLGREGLWSELLEEHLQQTIAAEAARSERGWSTFAADAARTNQASVAAERIDPAGQIAWQVAWGTTPLARRDGALSDFAEADPALPYLPIVVNGQVVWAEANCLRSLRLADGQPTLPLGTPADERLAEKGVIWLADAPARTAEGSDRGWLGQPRFTATSGASAVWARVGPPVTSDREKILLDQPSIVGVQLEQQGRLIPGTPLIPEPTETWTWEGTPIVHEGTLFGLQRRTSPDTDRAALRLVALQLLGAAGEAGLPLRWERRFAEAETGAAVGWNESSHTLLSFDEDTLFLHSGLGYVAAVRATDGEPLWLVTYPRRTPPAERAATGRRVARDLVPCMVLSDRVLVLATHSDQLLCLDRFTGHLIWDVSLPETQHLVGTTQRYALVGGERLWWVDLERGRAVATFPGPPPLAQAPRPPATRPRGFGRAVMTQDRVLWPTRDHIFVFAGEPRAVLGADGRTWYEPLAKRIIELQPRGITGGHLLLVDSHLLIAGEQRMWALPLPPQVEP